MKNKISNQEYSVLSKKASQNSPIWKNMLFAFLVGGTICSIGEGFAKLYEYLGISKTDSPSYAMVSLIFLSVLLTSLSVYDNIAKYAGAGTLVPITGFANAVSSPAIEFKSEGLILGVGAKMFTIAGPVIVYGILASFVYGLIIYFIPIG